MSFNLDKVIRWTRGFHLGLPKGLFPSGLLTKTLYAFLDTSMRASNFSRLDLRFLIMSDEEYNACSSELGLCSFLHTLVISSLSPKYLSTPLAARQVT